MFYFAISHNYYFFIDRIRVIIRGAPAVHSFFVGVISYTFVFREHKMSNPNTNNPNTNNLGMIYSIVKNVNI